MLHARLLPANTLKLSSLTSSPRLESMTWKWVQSSCNRFVGKSAVFATDEKDEDGGENEEEEVEKDDQEDIFELEGAREELQLDPSKFQDQILDSATQGSDPGNRVTGRSGFEGKATDEPPSTSGREQVSRKFARLEH